MPTPRDFEKYSKMIRIHVKSFFKLLDKATKEERFYVDAQKKVNYIKPKDAAVGEELQGYLDAQKSGEEVVIQESAAAAPTAEKEEVPKAAPTATSTTVAPIHIKSYEKALAKAKENAHYIKELQSKINYIAKKDPALAAEFQLECDKLKNAQGAAESDRILQLKVDKVQKCIDLCNSYEPIHEKESYIASARERLKEVAALSAEKAAEYEQKIQVLEQGIAELKAGAAVESELINRISEQAYYIKSALLGQGIGDQINLEIEQRVSDYQSTVEGYLNNNFISDLKSLTSQQGILPPAVSSFVNHANHFFSNLDYKISDIQKDLKKPTDDVHKAYELALCLDCESEILAQIFPEYKDNSKEHAKIKEILKSLTSREAVTQHQAANYEKFTDEAVMRKNKMNDPELVEKVKNYFQLNKMAPLGDPLRIVIPYEVWEVEKNAFDIPIEKKLFIDIAAEDTAENKFYINSLWLKQTYEGGGYGPIHFGGLSEKIREIRKANIEK